MESQNILARWMHEYAHQRKRARDARVIEGTTLTLSEHHIARPCVIIGEAGSGKTETLLRLAYTVALIYGYQVIFVDAKGDLKTAARFLAAMHKAGKKRASVFPIQSFSGWQGDALAIFNRLMAILDFSEPYYEDTTNLMLSLATNAPEGPPRNSSDLLRRLSLDELRLLYQGRNEMTDLARIQEKDANGTYNRYRGFFKLLNGKVDAGFTLDEVDACYLALDGIALRKEASALGRFLVEDIAHYITRRKSEEQKALIIIDEVSALAIENIANLAERLRSYGGCMVLASQSETGLAKTRDERDRILTTAHTIILHTCNNPDGLVTRAGKQAGIETGWNFDANQTGTGYGTMRQKKEPLITPDDVRRLDVGEAYVFITGMNGSAHKIRVAQVPVTGAEAAQHWQHLQELTISASQEKTTPLHVSPEETPQDDIEWM